MKLDVLPHISTTRRLIDWALLRRPPSVLDTMLSRNGAAWLGRIPVPARPLLTSKRFPRIVNELAVVWDKTDKATVYFRSLLHDERGGREGFPCEILEELVNLKAYYDEVLEPAASGLWDETNLF